jgi:hypothetical protein
MVDKVRSCIAYYESPIRHLIGFQMRDVLAFFASIAVAAVLRARLPKHALRDYLLDSIDLYCTGTYRTLRLPRAPTSRWTSSHASPYCNSSPTSIGIGYRHCKAIYIHLDHKTLSTSIATSTPAAAHGIFPGNFVRCDVGLSDTLMA